MKRGFTIFLLFLQAIIILLLFFAQDTLQYATLIVFGIIDILLLASLVKHSWSFGEIFTLASFFASLIFLMLYMFIQSTYSIVFGIVVMLLFIVSAMLLYRYEPSEKSQEESIRRPEQPTHKYDLHETAHDEYKDVAPVFVPPVVIQTMQPDKIPAYKAQPAPALHEIHKPATHKPADEKTQKEARATAYELEREASELTRAEQYISRKETTHKEDELVREAVDLEKAGAYLRDQETRLKSSGLKREAESLQEAQRQISRSQKNTMQLELSKEVKELEEVQRQFDEIKHVQQKDEIRKETDALKKAQSQYEKIRQSQGKREISKEAKALQDAQKKYDNIRSSSIKKSLKKEAKTIQKAQRQINIVKGSQKKTELMRQAKELEDVEKQAKELEFLNNKEKVISQARELAKAQAQINVLQKKPAQKTKIIRIEKKSYFVATKTGNRFHEQGCLTMKKVPKKQLILFTSKKEALKKGYQPCDVCKP